jgi:hypothetical protein
VDWNEHHVSILQPHVASIDSVQQVIIEIQGVDQLASPAHLDATEAPVRAGAARCVERGENRSRSGHLKRAGPHYVAHHEYLNVPNSSHRDLEPGGRSRPSSNSGIHSAQTAVEHVLELRERQVRDMDLTHLGNDDESLAIHVEGINLLDITGENQDKHIAGAESVVRVDRSGLRGLKAGGRPAKCFETEDLEPAGVQDADRVSQRICPGGVRPHQTERVQYLLQGVGHRHGGVSHLQRVQLRHA